jgi:hypothetical protein
VLDEEVWAALGGSDAGPVLQEYTVTADDLAEVIGEDLSDDYSDLAEMDLLGYASNAEALAERFHMDQDFLVAMNPDSSFAEGDTIVVADPGGPLDGAVDRIEVRKGSSRLAAFDADGNMVANYPVTIGSESNPSPSGTVEVVTVAFDPTYSYDPENFQQADNDEPLELPPGRTVPGGLGLDRPVEAHLWAPRHAPPVAALRGRKPRLRAPDKLGCGGTRRDGERGHDRGVRRVRHWSGGLFLCLAATVAFGQDARRSAGAG